MVEARDQITFVQATYHTRLNQTLECVRRVTPYVDRIVIVFQDYTDDDYAQLNLARNGTPMQVIRKAWLDHFSAQRNRYLSAVSDGWFLCSDPDEWFGEEALKSLRPLIQDSRFGSRYNVVAFNPIDTFYSDDYTKILSQNRPTAWWKQLFYKYYAGMYYRGVVHEQMIWPPELTVRGVNAPPEMFYEHVKTNLEQRERGCRNFFIGGGGVNDQGDKFPEWKDFRSKLLLEQGITEWHQFNAYLKAGNIASWLKDWILQYRNWNEHEWMSSEIRGLFYYYFVRLHPEENVDKLRSDFNE